ncbi:hypothetical protein HK099_005397 [Clydaea vesicula]|uniref:Uncharacterized protein n=1 Tax=Clydaea vesicula TaxID=447962 RepID=A0AAD5TZA4_9FUNG|nr:hypothetical protein HK099_005397 [Clydaea vesicula]
MDLSDTLNQPEEVFKSFDISFSAANLNISQTQLDNINSDLAKLYESCQSISAGKMRLQWSLENTEFTSTKLDFEIPANSLNSSSYLVKLNASYGAEIFTYTTILKISPDTFKISLGGSKMLSIGQDLNIIPIIWKNGYLTNDFSDFILTYQLYNLEKIITTAEITSNEVIISNLSVGDYEAMFTLTSGFDSYTTTESVLITVTNTRLNTLNLYYNTPNPSISSKNFYLESTIENEDLTIASEINYVLKKNNCDFILENDLKDANTVEFFDFILTPRGSNIVKFAPNFLEQDAVYCAESIYHDTLYNSTIISKIEFTTLPIPKGGKCFSQRSSGVPMHTIFSFQCSGYLADSASTQLLYMFEIRYFNDLTVGHWILFQYSQDQILETILPKGKYEVKTSVLDQFNLIDYHPTILTVTVEEEEPVKNVTIENLTGLSCTFPSYQCSQLQNNEFYSTSFYQCLQSGVWSKKLACPSKLGCYETLEIDIICDWPQNHNLKKRFVDINTVDSIISYINSANDILQTSNSRSKALRNLATSSLLFVNSNSSDYYVARLEFYNLINSILEKSFFIDIKTTLNSISGSLQLVVQSGNTFLSKSEITLVFNLLFNLLHIADEKSSDESDLVAVQTLTEYSYNIFGVLIQNSAVLTEFNEIISKNYLDFMSTLDNFHLMERVCQQNLAAFEFEQVTKMIGVEFNLKNFENEYLYKIHFENENLNAKQCYNYILTLIKNSSSILTNIQPPVIEGFNVISLNENLVQIKIFNQTSSFLTEKFWNENYLTLQNFTVNLPKFNSSNFDFQTCGYIQINDTENLVEHINWQTKNCELVQYNLTNIVCFCKNLPSNLLFTTLYYKNSTNTQTLPTDISPSDNSNWQLIGIIFLVVLLLILAVLSGYFLWKKKTFKLSKVHHSDESVNSVVIRNNDLVEVKISKPEDTEVTSKNRSSQPAVDNQNKRIHPFTEIDNNTTDISNFQESGFQADGANSNSKLAELSMTFRDSSESILGINYKPTVIKINPSNLQKGNLADWKSSINKKLQEIKRTSVITPNTERRTSQLLFDTNNLHIISEDFSPTGTLTLEKNEIYPYDTSVSKRSKSLKKQQKANNRFSVNSGFRINNQLSAKAKSLTLSSVEDEIKDHPESVDLGTVGEYLKSGFFVEDEKDATKIEKTLKNVILTSSNGNDENSSNGNEPLLDKNSNNGILQTLQTEKKQNFTDGSDDMNSTSLTKNDKSLLNSIQSEGEHANSVRSSVSFIDD